ncbi:hypothetical protein LSH36_29g03010 [Paralvinella palmiformis]|uniref:Uncharacterized protein n=1 Tax=Paralvinella palmiformis TaxID=53620 RepID=A0AAD9NGE5_9ANNE|nr:hypothetical protein LSH36_29g03010 [Paralvinella palmiformis]
MKVTILQQDSTCQLIKSDDSQQPTRKQHSRSGAEGDCSRGQTISFYFVGFIFGFVLSQCLIQRYHRQLDQDHINVYIKVDTFETPVKVYIEGSTTWTKDQHIVKDLSWNKLETSLFMSAILKVVQDNIRREIEADGFIIVDKPDQEVYRSQKIQTIRRTDPKRHVTLSQFGGRFFRKWSSRLHLLWDSGHEAKLLQQDQSGNRVSTKAP